MSLNVGIDRLAVNFRAGLAKHLDAEITVLTWMLVAEATGNQFGVLYRAQIRWKVHSHSVSDRYPIPHVKIVSWHHSLSNGGVGGCECSQGMSALEHSQNRSSSEVSPGATAANFPDARYCYGNPS